MYASRRSISELTRNPIVLAAVIAFFATLLSSLLLFFNAHLQRNTDMLNAQLQRDTDMRRLEIRIVERALLRPRDASGLAGDLCNLRNAKILHYERITLERMIPLFVEKGAKGVEKCQDVFSAATRSDPP
jgi:hypothetical protein